VSALDSVLEVGDLVDVTYYIPLEGGGTIEEHRANGVYKRCERVTLRYVREVDGLVHFSYVDHCHPSCGGISLGDLEWADVEHVEVEGALW